MKIVASCSDQYEADQVAASLKAHGLYPFVHGVHQNSWRRFSVPVHVTVPPEQAEKAFKVIAASFPNLCLPSDDVLCPTCKNTKAPPKPFTLTFIKALWTIPRVRFMGCSFCPACHRTWRLKKI